MTTTCRTRIKICGVKTGDDIRAAADAGADAVGFVFHRASKRYIAPEAAWELSQAIPALVTSVGLFVNAGVDEFCQVEEICPTVLSQLHGIEDEDTVAACGPNVIKAVRFDEAKIDAELQRWSALDEVCAILVDGSAGGEGRSLDWGSLAPRVSACAKPIILAGGLTPDNVADAVRIVRPYAVDVSSGVEKTPGVKDATLMATFCRAVRDADR
ncbi:MAG: N-(5'-phosphoribosyl)anthranilate isomerase [Phycisphaerales bacterium]